MLIADTANYGVSHQNKYDRQQPSEGNHVLQLSFPLSKPNCSAEVDGLVLSWRQSEDMLPLETEEEYSSVTIE